MYQFCFKKGREIIFSTYAYSREEALAHCVVAGMEEEVKDCILTAEEVLVDGKAN